ncbi:MAG: tRNA (adenosine(37)-N6)-dimethylallyltransferase MiaA [Christensenellaceae bacterium]|nr:tRNA (adenosine(37)-N6)-dimethylallyltransferase MiaA [Christensenellaceae bacterium]
MQKIVSIVGLTASGKSGLGIKIAREFNGEIISADSRQVYRGLDIGSAKVTEEEQKLVKHHLLDVVDPGEKFDVFEFQKRAYEAIDDILSRGKLPIIVGGTGLYSRSVVEGYEFGGRETDIFSSVSCDCGTRMPLRGTGATPLRLLAQTVLVADDTASKTSVPLPSCPGFEVLQVCLMPSKEFIRPLVEKRIDERLKCGMIQETKQLLERGVSEEWLQSLGLEYFWNVEYIKGRVTLDEYKKWLCIKSMQFAKRQRTWFKKEKNTVFLTEPENFYLDAMKLIKRFLT